MPASTNLIKEIARGDDRNDQHVRPRRPHADAGARVFVELKREMIRKRTRAGLHHERAQKCAPGRKLKITPEQKIEVVQAVASGRKMPAKITRMLKIHRETVSRIVAQVGVGV